MIRTFQHLWLLLVVSSLLAVPAAKAGVFKGHPYHDSHCCGHFGGGIVVSDAGGWGVPCAGNCGPAGVIGMPAGQALIEPQTLGQWYAGPLVTASGLGKKCPPATNALLRVWVNDSALLFVNGTQTKPQKLAGANRGSRIFSLTGLQPSIMTVAVVRAQITFAGDSQPTILEKEVPVLAGRQHEVRITDEELAQARAQVRASAGLVALYDFKLAGASNIIRDVSGAGTPLDLFIHDTSKVVWLDGGGLRIAAPVIIQSGMPAEKIRLTAQRTNEITIEAWVTPAATATAPPGPVRIVSLSGNYENRSFTLAQQGNSYDVRLRTTDTNVNGIPSTSSLPGAVRTDLTHVVFTRDSAGTATIFLDGRPFSRRHVSGLMSEWDPFHLLLANELIGDRPWLGTFHLVAIYGRALTSEEVKQNHKLGP